MTIVQLINFLHGCGLDVLALGLLDGLLTSLIKKISQKLKRNVPKAYSTAVPFLLGMFLYAVCVLCAFRDFSLLKNATLIAERGFSVGIAATLLRTLAERFLKALPPFPQLKAKRFGRQQPYEPSEEGKDSAAL